MLYNLYSRIDKQNLECLNEVQENSGRDVFRPWDERLLKDHVSDLLIFEKKKNIETPTYFKWMEIII